MITDLNKNLSVSRYNYLNLPEQIEISMDGLNHINYLYSAAGTKLTRQTVEEGTPDEEITTNYLGSFVYEDNQLRYLLTQEGRIVFNPDGSHEYQYFLKDHLGNTRVTFNAGGIIQEDSYYPFGMAMADLSHQTGEDLPNQYLYNGKELQDDFGLEWYDYGARFYDPVIGRWYMVDPMAEEYVDLSPYNYVAGNPIIFIDPDGKRIWPGAGLIQANVENKVDNETVSQVHTMQGKQSAHAVTYAAMISTLGTGTIAGLSVGVPILGMKFTSDIASVAGADQGKLNKIPETPFGLTAATITKAAGGNEELIGAVGDLAFSVASITAILKKPKSLLDAIIFTANAIGSYQSLERTNTELNKESSEQEIVVTRDEDIDPFRNVSVKPEVFNKREFDPSEGGFY